MDVLLPDYQCVFDGKSQTQHDQVGISPVETVSVVLHEILLVPPNKLHYFVLALPWGVRTRKNNAQSLPIVILLNFLLNKKVKHFVELMHEGGSW